jgi:prephenate dehydrogenase
MTKITIFGVGLIGGSLALCFKDIPGFHVVGHSNNPLSVEKLIKRHAVHHATTSMQEAVEDADFIFLCVPVGSLEPYLAQIMDLPLKKGCIITDVGSTKSSITKQAQAYVQLNRDVTFIGGHPMAGSERTGVEAATIDLFENAYYVLTPFTDTPTSQVEKLSQLLVHTKAQIIQIDAHVHDDIVGAISHLPHIVAVALVNQIRKYHESSPLYQLLAAGGFRDITRIASGDPHIWRDILIHNRDVLLPLLEDWNKEISHFVALLQQQDGEGIADEFRQAGNYRTQLPERRKGMISSQYDIYVDITDQPGTIGQIATLIGSKHINLSNIQIIESRIDVPGVLRLSFRNQKDADQAYTLLSPMYTVHR